MKEERKEKKEKRSYSLAFIVGNRPKKERGVTSSPA